jgi:hypothetical protein
MAVNVPIISTFDAKGINKAIRDFKKLKTNGERMGFALQNSNAAMNKGIATFAKFGAIGAGVVGIIGSKLVGAARESQKVMKQTEAIVKATGGSANLSATQISNLSEKLAVQTGVDDELIQKNMNLLLTFKAIRNEVGQGNDVFTQASQAALDLGNVFGSTDAAAIQLGKALSNPVRGVTALRKSGIDFTDQQIAQIKTLVASNKVLDAQKLILKEIQQQVGGTAAASATDFDRMQVAIGNVAEDLGELLLPAVEAFARFVTTTLVPIVQEFADIVGNKGLGAGLKFLGEQGLKAIGNLKGFGAVVYGVVAAVVALKVATAIYTAAQLIATIAMAAFGTTAAGAAVAVNAAFFGIPAIIGLIAVAVTALALKFKGFRETLIPLLIGVTNKFLDLFVNPFIKGINLVIKGINLIKIGKDIDPLSEFQISRGKKETNKILGGRGTSRGRGAGDLSILDTTFSRALGSGSGGGGGGGGGGAVAKGKDAVEKYTKALQLFGRETKNVTDKMKALSSAQLALANTTDNVRVAQDKFNKVSMGYGANSKQANDATKDLAQSERDAVRANINLANATQDVTEAQKTLNELMSGNVGATQQDIIDAREALTLAQLAEVEANIAVADAQQDVIDKQTLLTQAVSGASAETDVYKEALKELAEAQAAEKDAVDAVTEAYENQAQALRDLQEAKKGLSQAKKGTTGKQERRAQRRTGINAVTGAPITSQSSSNIASTFSAIDLAGFVPFFANGGIVNRPTLGMIGESGAEAVIPLDRLNTGGSTINITVNAGMGSDGTKIGQLIVNELQAYQRRVGALPLKVSN